MNCRIGEFDEWSIEAICRTTFASQFGESAKETVAYLTVAAYVG